MALREEAEPSELRWRRASTDNAPARNVWGYLRLLTGWHQVALGALALLAAALNLAPVELQRRIIDDAVVESDAALLWTLVAIYAAALVSHKLLKFVLQLYQGWVTERTAAYTRRHVLFLSGMGSQANAGETVTVVNTEIDKLAGFVGAGPSDALRDVATLLGVLGYMFWTAPKVAAVALLLLAPQAVIAPLIQRRLNRLIKTRLRLLRRLSDVIAGEREGRATKLVVDVLRNRLSIVRLKAMMKAVLNLFNSGAPLAVLAVGGWLVIQGETTVGVVVAFVSGLERVSNPLRNLIAFYRQSAQAGVQHDLIAKWIARFRSG